jgi:hypothetical protein
LKKLVVILALITVLVGIVFGASVLAAPTKPAGQDVLMESQGGYVENYSGSGGVVAIGPFYYPDVAHVSLTLYATGLDAGDDIYLMISLPTFSGSEWVEFIPLGNGATTLQFDTTSWYVGVDLATNIDVQCNWTATYPNPK